jgi:hypothetical protein
MHVKFLARPFALVAAAVVLIGVLNGANATVRPRAVTQLRIANPTQYDFDVAVSRDGRTWLPLALATKRTTTVVEDVADQGTRWQFELRAQGVAAGRLTVTRAQLKAHRWTFEIPTRVGAELRDLGVPLPP